MTDSEVKFVRLKTGDDVIAEMVEIEDEHGIMYALYNPLRVDYVTTESSNYLSVMFSPWVYPRICEDQEFIIHAEDVLFTSNVTQKINDYYWENIEHYVTKTLKEEEKVNTSNEDYERLKEALETMGLDTKKVYH